MEILSPATSANLGPGFDSLGLSIRLFNEVSLTRQKITSVSILGEGASNPNLKTKNSFISIFNEIYYNLTGLRENFKFSFHNKIPFSRGLGSSSSIIVSAVVCAYHMAGLKIDKRVILNRALEFENHPDNIAPATFGGFTASIVNDNKVFTQRANLDENLKAVVVIPDKPMNTKQSRGKLPKQYKMADVVHNLSHSAFLTACFLNKDYDNLRIASIDKMHEDIRMQGLAELFEVRKIAYLNGALMSNLSGSGSSFLNLTYGKDANKLHKILSEKFPNFRVEIFELDNDGVMIIKS